VLDPGKVLTDCQIIRDSSDGYVVAFECGPRKYVCPLYAFLPRTVICVEVAEYATL
jgi:hypothetical protein